MKKILLIVSGLFIVLGLWAGPCHHVIQLPADFPLYDLRMEIEKSPLDEAKIARMQALLNDGIRRNQKERSRLSAHLTSVSTALFILGIAGGIVALWGRTHRLPIAETTDRVS